MNILGACERYFTPVGRIIIGAFFLLAGANKVMDFAGTAGYIEFMGLPMPAVLATLAIILEIGAGGAMIIGYQTKYAALALATFTVVASLLFHGPQLWSADDPTQQLMFMKNFAIIGGLLFMAAHVGAPCCNPNHDHSSSTSTPTPTL